MFKQLFATLVLMLLALPLSAQVKVTGKVTDENNSPLPGASILVKGTTHGVSSDFDGNYAIEAKQGDVLEISFIGFQTQTKKVTGSGKQTINVVLKEDAQQLSDVVVVGYGTTSKRKITSSVATVDVATVASIPTASISDGLQGRVNGVIMTTSSGAPGSKAQISIRGGGTPLFIIDGVI